jgi:DNA-binding response OmpR family regulator
MKEQAIILIVDDEPEVCGFLKEFLEMKGYAVLTALSGAEALQCVQEQPPDLMLLDIKMQGMDGLETLRRIRALNRTLSVIMLSGISDEEIAQQTIREGAQDYLVKPLNLSYLELTILTELAAERTNRPGPPLRGHG